MKYDRCLTEEQRLFWETLRFCGLSIIHAKKLTYDSSWWVNHILNTNELFFVRGGGFYLETEGRRHYMDKNKMVCIPANVYRSIYIEQGGFAEFYTMQFYAEAGGVSYFNFVGHMPPVDMSECRDEAERLFKGMADIEEPMSHAAVLKRIGFAGELLGLFLEKARAEVKLPKRKTNVDFGIVMAHIDRNYRYKKISIAELADLACISEGYFRRAFKKEYGISCNMYINSLRMEGVLKMLRESDAPLKMIAENFRYTDTAYLSRIVKKQTGLTPIEYRRKHGR